MERISVIVPVLVNTEQHIQMTTRCIKTARETTKLPFELIIIETGTDYFGDLADVYIQEKQQTTTTISINRGWKVSNKDWKVYLSNDVFVKENWLECLLDCFKIPDCGVATLATSQLNHKKQDSIIEAIWFSLAMIPQYIFDKVGYFDEQYPGVFDDTDLLLRIYQAGYKEYMNFNCVVDHTPGSTVYAMEGHKDRFKMGRYILNEKFKDCKLPIFQKLK